MIEYFLAAVNFYKNALSCTSVDDFKIEIIAIEGLYKIFKTELFFSKLYETISLKRE